MAQGAVVDTNVVGGQVVTSAGVRRVGISIKDGRIVAIAQEEVLPPARETLDAKGLYVLPGLVDSEAHPGCYVPFEQDIRTETRAAAAAGVTTWGVHAPVTRLGLKPFREVPQPEDVVSFHKAFPFARDIINEFSLIDIFLTYMLETDQQADEIPEYARENGVTSFKLYLHCMRPEVDKYWARGRAGLVVGFDDGVVFQTMRKVAEVGDPAIRIGELPAF